MTLNKVVTNTFSARDMGNLGLTDKEQLIFAKDEKAAIFTHVTWH